MSESVQSNKDQYEETEDMLEETPSTRKNPEYTLSEEEDEVEDSDERLNNYQYDGFVVHDDFEDETDEMAGTDTESKKREKKRRRKKKDFSLDKEDTDLLE
jgi:transcription elongation factor SPT6